MNGQPAPPPPAPASAPAGPGPSRPAWINRLTDLPWWAWLGVPLVAWLASRLFVTGLGVIASLSFGRA